MAINKESSFSELNNQAAAQKAAESTTTNAQDRQASAQSQTQTNTGYEFNNNNVRQGYVPNELRNLGLGNYSREYDIPYNAVNGRLQAYHQALEEIAKGTVTLTAHGNYKLFMLDGESNGLAASAILFVRYHKNVAAVFPLIIGETAENLPVSTVQSPNPQIGTIQIPRLAEEFLTTENYYGERVVRFAQSQLTPLGVTDVVLVGGLVLPKRLEPKNIAQLDRVLFYANAAAQYTLTSIPGTRSRFTLAQMGNSERLEINHLFNPGQSATSTGLPVRNDLTIKLQVAENTNTKAPLGARSQNSIFSMVRGFFSLQYSPSQAQPIMNGFMYQQPVFNPPYQAYFNITSLDNHFGNVDLETQLLALATCTSILYNNTWINAFAPNNALRSNDPRDIGVLSYDYQYAGETAAITDTKDSKFNLAEFCAKYIKPGVIFTMDIPELGDLTYIQRAFLLASGATGNAEMTAEANRVIIEAANYLTDGAFSNYFNPATPIVLPQIGRIEQGYYINANGEMRDLAEIDYLYLLNMHDQDLDKARLYQDSFNPSWFDETTRFGARQKLYEVYVPGYEITGYARRLTINTDFLVALNQALTTVAGNFNVVSNNIFNQLGQERGYNNNVVAFSANQATNYMHMMYGNNNRNNGIWMNYNNYGYMPR